MKNIFIIVFFLYAVNLFGQFKSDMPVSELEKNFHIKKNFRNIANYKSDTTINVNYYKLELALQTAPNLLTGKVTINSLVTVASINSLFYDLSNVLTVDSVTSTAGATNFSHTNDKIQITLPRSYTQNELTSITIYYHGLPDPTGFGSFEFGSHNNNPDIWTLS